jgi:hypothetical protein
MTASATALRRRRIAEIAVHAAAIVVMAVALAVAEPAAAQETAGTPEAGKVMLELNKTEDQANGCRIYFVLDNTTTESFEAFKLDLVVFAPDGVILRNLATEMAPLRAAKRVVKMFDLADLACDRVGSLLVNDVLECRAAEPRSDCVDLLAVDTRAAVLLVK